jgi:hypothetical protein
MLREHDNIKYTMLGKVLLLKTVDGNYHDNDAEPYAL